MLYTIGFTKSTAEHFFDRLEKNSVDILFDVRLNNTSQLAGFAKFPDIEWFAHRILKIRYLHDSYFSPTEDILKEYQKKVIDWKGYELRFEKLMRERAVEEYITEKYTQILHMNICFLCSEPTAEHCHRRLVAKYFARLAQTSVRHI